MKIEDVWSEYRTSIKSFLHSRISDADEVDDLLQEILIKTYNNLSSVKSEESIKSWLFQIANNTIVDFYRKRGKAKTVNAEDLWYGEDDLTAQTELSGCIEPFVKALPKETARLLMEIDLNGRS